MGRPRNEDLTRQWKNTIPATIAGSVEVLLLDPIHGKPIYAARARLITMLLEMWLAAQAGRPVRPMPSLEEIRDV